MYSSCQSRLLNSTIAKWYFLAEPFFSFVLERKTRYFLNNACGCIYEALSDMEHIVLYTILTQVFLIKFCCFVYSLFGIIAFCYGSAIYGFFKQKGTASECRDTNSWPICTNQTERWISLKRNDIFYFFDCCRKLFLNIYIYRIVQKGSRAKNIIPRNGSKKCKNSEESRKW